MACALALASSHVGDGLTLLVSTDPAPSIADAFGQPNAAWARADIEAELDDVHRASSFVRWTRPPRSLVCATRISRASMRCSRRSSDAEWTSRADRAIVRDLLALAPPGVDELFALSTLGDALFEGRFRRIIVDPAPTGHLLRLLEMPAIALDWSHRIMRLMLKYRDVVGLGETAQELLDFAKRTRSLEALLHDAAQCGLVFVSLDEPLVRTRDDTAGSRGTCARHRRRRNRLESCRTTASPSSSNRCRAPSCRQGSSATANRCASDPRVVALVANRAPEFLTVVHGFIDVERSLVRVRHRAGELRARTLPNGLDDADVALERGDGVAALVSTLPATQYEPPTLEANSGDVDWLSPRAVAHDRVLTWASDLGPVVPLPMFSLFSGQPAVCAMLHDREAELVATLARLAEGREYALRVYRVDSELLSTIASLSPRLAELAATAAAASPGQRYLLERKLETEKRNEMRAVSQRLIDEIASALDAALASIGSRGHSAHRR